MIQSFLYMMIISISMIFMQMNHPLTMGLILLVQTTMICMMTGLLNKTFWFSYVLFLVFVGGMLVMFIYVTSLASNEMFSMSKKTMLMTLIMLMMSMMLPLLTDNMMVYPSTLNYETSNMYNTNSYIKENMLNLNILYNYPHNMITIMMMIYLLITLIISVKITKKNEGPLRKMN